MSGRNAVDVGVDESTTVLLELVHGTITWTEETAVPLLMPAALPGLDMDRYRFPEIVNDYTHQTAELRVDRRVYLGGFDDLDPDIVDAVY